MARPTKQGLDYFPFDVGFFGDKNVRILKARYRSDGIAVYIKLLCDIYKEGYYLPVERWEDYMFVIADELGTTTNAVEQIIRFLQSHAMIHVFNQKEELTGLDVDAVITSHGIQKRYAAAIKSRKKGVDEIRRGFWLLSDDEEQEIKAFYKRAENEGFSEKNPDKSEKNPDKSEKNHAKESKVKESKDIVTTNNKDTSNNSTYIGTDELNIFQAVAKARQEARRDFFAKYTNLKDDPSVDDSHIDYRKLAERFARSKKHLQDAHSLAWVVRNYTSILEDKYVDYAEKPSGNSAASSASSAPSTPKEKPLPADVLAANARSERERFYARRREKAQNTAEQFTARIKQTEPRFKEITTDLSKMEFALAKAEVFEPSKLPALKKEKGALLAERGELLARLGIKEEQLLPEFYHVCKRCQDTGFLPSGAACKCYKKEN